MSEAYERSTPKEFRSEFAFDEAELERAMTWSAFAAELTTNLHEVIGHGSGLVSEALNGQPEAALKEQFSTIEEARADLVALYFVADPVMVELGLVAADALADVARPNTRATRETRSSSSGASARAARSKKTTCGTGS